MVVCIISRAEILRFIFVSCFIIIVIIIIVVVIVITNLFIIFTLQHHTHNMSQHLTRIEFCHLA